MIVTGEQYFGTLECTDDGRREKALRRAYAQRTFEIEHYWKRATFFGVSRPPYLLRLGLRGLQPNCRSNSHSLVDRVFDDSRVRHKFSYPSKKSTVLDKI